jgi:thiamine pyrophosphokinase
VTTPTIIVAGGDPVEGIGDVPVAADAFVIAADSGLHSARSLGLSVDLVVGDLDSAAPGAVAEAIAAGAAVERHPTDKDATDLELALEAALARDLSPAFLLGGAGFDRIDHFMANALLLAAPRYAPLRPRWHVKGATVIPVHDRVEIEGRAGDTVTLLAVAGPAAGIATEGLRWTVDRLEPGSTRGVSNEMTSARASVALTSGTLLAIIAGRSS